MIFCLWYFWIYSFLGWLVELAFALASRSAERRRRCFLLLPLCPVYGLGMLAALALPPMGWLGLTVWGGMAATAVEYAVHWAGERFLRVEFWDYSQVSGNLRGRVCLPFSLAWGLLSLGLVHWLQPLLLPLLARIPDPVSWAAVTTLLADAALTAAALRRSGDTGCLQWYKNNRRPS